MSSYITKLAGYLNTSKTFVQEKADKVATKAKRSGKSFKEYIHDDENVSHISLVVYDVLPLPLKFAIRYEKFNKKFTNNFALIREKIFDAPKKEVALLTETINSPKPVAKKAPAKKTAVKKVVKNAPEKKVVTKKLVEKKIVIRKAATPAKVVKKVK